MRNVLYEKRGRRYYPVQEEFSGFPASGVWLVKHGDGVKSSRLVLELEGDPCNSMELFDRTIKRDHVYEAVIKVLQQAKNPMSYDDIANAVAQELVKGA